MAAVTIALRTGNRSSALVFVMLVLPMEGCSSRQVSYKIC